MTITAAITVRPRPGGPAGGPTAAAITITAARAPDSDSGCTVTGVPAESAVTDDLIAKLWSRYHGASV